MPGGGVRRAVDVNYSSPIIGREVYRPEPAASLVRIYSTGWLRAA
jgi:hypothetical protein